MKTYVPVVAGLLNARKPAALLDAPCGGGWPRDTLHFKPIVDGIDLFENKPEGYRSFLKSDLEDGIPEQLGRYDAIISCEGIEHFGNPLRFLETANKHLNDNGLIIITTPNIWYPHAKIIYLLRGFFPSFPCLVGKVKKGTHMHITPWSYPQLYTYLRLAGFTDIKLHDIPGKKPKHLFEYVLGLPQMLYCRRKLKKARSKEERAFWQDTGSAQSLFGRRLVVSAVSKGVDSPHPSDA